VYLPKLVLPCIVLFTNTIKFIMVLGLLLVLMMSLSEGPNLHWLALPLIVLVEFTIILAAASLMASLVPLLPELKLVIDNGLIVLMFLSGIFTEIDKLPPRIAEILHANPMVPIIEAFRAVLLQDTWPDWAALSWVLGLAILAYALAFWILRHNDRAYLKLMSG
jgi:lipopolysaccharide transport system permease protein